VGKEKKKKKKKRQKKKKRGKKKKKKRKKTLGKRRVKAMTGSKKGYLSEMKNHQIRGNDSSEKQTISL